MSPEYEPTLDNLINKEIRGWLVRGMHKISRIIYEINLVDMTWVNVQSGEKGQLPL